MSDRDELHLLTGAYALGALQGEEKEEFEAYLLTSEEARAEVASLSDTAVAIGLASVPEAPPAALKSRLMAQLSQTPQLPALDDEGVAPGVGTEERRHVDLHRYSARRTSKVRHVDDAEPTFAPYPFRLGMRPAVRQQSFRVMDLPELGQKHSVNPPNVKCFTRV